MTDPAATAAITAADAAVAAAAAAAGIAALDRVAPSRALSACLVQYHIAIQAMPTLDQARKNLACARIWLFASELAATFEDSEDSDEPDEQGD